MTECDICGKEVKDILRHFVIAHGIKSINHLKVEINGAEKEKIKRAEFRKYVEELHEKIKRGEISTEDYRKLVTQWSKEH
jgi:uncharacterized membrane protein